MQLYYSKSTGGFYDDTIHTPDQIPGDAVPIDAQTHTALLVAQAQGKEIAGDSNGHPVAVPATPPPVHLPTAARGALDVTDRVVMRCFENGVAVPAVWLSYRNALRAIANGSDTQSTSLPVMPAYPAGT